MMKISRSSAGIFLKYQKNLTNARNFQTHAGKFKQSGNLLCHIIGKKTIIFYTIKCPNPCWKFPDALQKFVPIWKFLNTRRKFPDTGKKL